MNRIESNHSLVHKRHGNFFKLHMPISVLLGCRYRQVVRAVVVLVKIYMMDALTLHQHPSALFGRYQDMLRYITRFIGIGMCWVKYVIIAVPKRRFFASLSFRFCYENSTASPGGVKRSSLIALCSYARRNIHFPHSSPNHLLSGAVFYGDFSLAHSQFHVVPKQFRFSERHFVGIGITHAGIITDASGSEVRSF